MSSSPPWATRRAACQAGAAPGSQTGRVGIGARPTWRALRSSGGPVPRRPQALSAPSWSVPLFFRPSRSAGPGVAPPLSDLRASGYLAGHVELVGTSRGRHDLAESGGSAECRHRGAVVPVGRLANARRPHAPVPTIFAADGVRCRAAEVARLAILGRHAAGAGGPCRAARAGALVRRFRWIEFHLPCVLARIPPDVGAFPHCPELPFCPLVVCALASFTSRTSLTYTEFSKLPQVPLFRNPGHSGISVGTCFPYFRGSPYLHEAVSGNVSRAQGLPGFVWCRGAMITHRHGFAFIATQITYYVWVRHTSTSSVGLARMQECVTMRRV